MWKYIRFFYYLPIKLSVDVNSWNYWPIKTELLKRLWVFLNSKRATIGRERRNETGLGNHSALPLFKLRTNACTYNSVYIERETRIQCAAGDVVVVSSLWTRRLRRIVCRLPLALFFSSLSLSLSTLVHWKYLHTFVGWRAPQDKRRKKKKKQTSSSAINKRLVPSSSFKSGHVFYIEQHRLTLAFQHLGGLNTRGISHSTCQLPGSIWKTTNLDFKISFFSFNCLLFCHETSVAVGRSVSCVHSWEPKYKIYNKKKWICLLRCASVLEWKPTSWRHSISKPKYLIRTLFTYKNCL